MRSRRIPTGFVAVPAFDTILSLLDRLKEAPLLVQTEGLRAALWAAQCELHACEAAAVTARQLQHDQLLRDLARETDAIRESMAQALHAVVQ